jgi:hypothetical protein
MEVFPWGEKFFFFSGFIILFEERVSSVENLILDSIDALAPNFFFSPSIRSNEMRVWFSFSLGLNFKGLKNNIFEYLWMGELGQTR